MINYGISGYSVVFKKELYDRKRLARIVEEDRHRLYTQIVSNARPVGLCVSRGIEMITMMQAMLESGITFVPIGIDFPIARIKYIIEDSGMEYIVTDQNFDFGGCQIISTSQVCPPDEEEIYRADENEIAYIMYTSGTTGMPKGVEVTTAGLLNFLEVLPKRIPMSASDTVACLTNNTFDIFFLESLLAMNRGARIILASDIEQTNPAFLCKLIVDNKVNMLQMTPSRMNLVAIYDKQLKSLASVEKVMIGGEAFPKTLLQMLQKKTNARIYNMYGPVEATIWATVSELTNEQEINIGEAMDHIEVFVADEKGARLPTEVIGEICIEGICLAQGYHNNEELTRKKFIQKDGKRIYRTGDIGRINSKGMLEHLGRADAQVKIRGYRIELEEIDVCMISSIPLVEGVVSCYRPSENGGMLVSFYVGKEEIDAGRFAEALKDKLPQYMIPVKYIRVEKLLYTQSGKADRKGMLDYYDNILCKSREKNDNQFKEDSLKNNMIFETVSKVIGDVVGVDKDKMLGCEDLRDIGMDSLKFISVIVAIEDTYDIEFEDEMLSMGRLRTVDSFVNYVNQLIIKRK